MTDTPTTNPLRAGLRMQRTPEPATMVIFGATGDLTHRKLVPALYNLQRERLLPPGFNVIGFARRDWSDDFFRNSLLKDARQHSRSGVEETLWQSFAESISSACNSTASSLVAETRMVSTTFRFSSSPERTASGPGWAGVSTRASGDSDGGTETLPASTPESARVRSETRGFAEAGDGESREACN